MERIVCTAVGGIGVEVVDVVVSGRVLRVLLDKPGGIDLDTLSDANRAISEALDGAPDVAPRSSYSLEVSSPGIERPLRTAEHFARFVGSEVSIRTRPGRSAERRVKGTLVAADDGAVVVEADGASHRILLDDVERARTVFDWGQTAKSRRPVGAGRQEGTGRR